MDCVHPKLFHPPRFIQKHSCWSRRWNIMEKITNRRPSLHRSPCFEVPSPVFSGVSLSQYHPFLIASVWVFPKIGVFTPQIMNLNNLNRVFHYFHHPFWGFPPIFGSTPMSSFPTQPALSLSMPGRRRWWPSNCRLRRTTWTEKVDWRYWRSALWLLYPFRRFIRGITPVRGLTNHGY